MTERAAHECLNCGETAFLPTATRTLPRSDESERAVIGAIMVTGGKLFADVAGSVTAEDFFHPGHRAIFGAMAVLDLARKPIDPTSVVETLRQSGSLEDIQSLGEEYLILVMDYAVGLENIAYHAQTVAERAEVRRLGAMLVELTARVYGAPVAHDELLAEVESRFLAMTRKRKGAGGPVGIKAGLRRVVTRVNERYTRRAEGIAATAIPVGLAEFDAVTCGLKPAQLVVLAGRPGAGKSALMGNMAENAARAGVGCLIFTLEMETDDTYERIVASNGVNSDHLRSGWMTTADLARMSIACSELAEPERIWVEDASDAGGVLTLTELRSRARRWRMHQAAKFERVLIFVDYLQLVHAQRQKNGNREQEIAEVSRGMKALAKELKCPVIALSQLNRGAENRQNKRPSMAELRESGQIEQDADMILLLYRDDLNNPESKEKGIAELNIAKHRGGPTAMLKLAWDSKMTRFADLRAPR